MRRNTSFSSDGKIYIAGKINCAGQNDFSCGNNEAANTMSSGAIAGIVVSSVVVLVLIGGLIYLKFFYFVSSSSHVGVKYSSIGGEGQGSLMVQQTPSEFE